MAGGKPIVKLYGKRKKDGDPALPEFLDVAAFWLNDDGKLGGQWSRDIVAIKMKDRDGKQFVVSAEQLKAYFCNLRDDREQIPMAAVSAAVAKAKATRAASAPDASSAPPDFGDDDIPFRRPFVTW